MSFFVLRVTRGQPALQPWTRVRCSLWQEVALAIHSSAPPLRPSLVRVQYRKIWFVSSFSRNRNTFSSSIANSRMALHIWVKGSIALSGGRFGSRKKKMSENEGNGID